MYLTRSKLNRTTTKESNSKLYRSIGKRRSQMPVSVTGMSKRTIDKYAAEFVHSVVYYHRYRVSQKIPNGLWLWMNYEYRKPTMIEEIEQTIVDRLYNAAG